MGIFKGLEANRFEGTGDRAGADPTGHSKMHLYRGMVWEVGGWPLLGSVDHEDSEGLWLGI